MKFIFAVLLLFNLLSVSAFLRLWTIKSPTLLAFISDKDNCYHALEKCEGLTNKENINIPSKNLTNNIINKINGFYGIIGPDIRKHQVSSLFDLFIGNGFIQGVFFDKGNITYVNHRIETEKLPYEINDGSHSHSLLSLLLFQCLHFMGLLPNGLGVANTALLQIDNHVYAMFERDQPYLMRMDFFSKSIHTVKKMRFPHLSSIYFSGHTKYIKNKIKTIHYNVPKREISYYSLGSDFRLLYKTNIETKYLPIIHDFLLLDDSFLVTESPILFDFIKLLSGKLPITFYKDRKTTIHLSAVDGTRVFEYDKGFYVFHYADYRETDESIEIYASLYDDLDFSSISIKGNYRKIVLDKQTRTVSIEKNEILEQYNLDFPIKIGNRVVLRNIHNNLSMNGFIICEGIDIIGTLLFSDMCICGEPALTYVDGKPYLLSFAYNETSNYILLIDPIKMTVEKNEINTNGNSLIMGFHSIFINK
jgi:hypothetical protein